MQIKIHSNSITVRATVREQNEYLDEANVDEIAAVFQTGDVGTLGTRTRVNGRADSEIVDVFLGDEDGLPGNSDRNKVATSGWRGTCNGVSVNAHGVIRVTDVQPLARGCGYRIAFERITA